MAEPSAKKRKSDEKKKAFRWSDEMHLCLIKCLKKYKSSCEFNSVDFDADKTLQYKTLRTEMAKIFDKSDNCPFGPVEVSEKPTGELTDDEKKMYNETMKKEQQLILQGYNRIIEKVKIMRQGFSKAVISGSRSGSGKIVYDNYDDLRDIWGGSANTTPLSTGVDSSFINDGSCEIFSYQDDLSECDDLPGTLLYYSIIV